MAESTVPFNGRDTTGWVGLNDAPHDWHSASAVLLQDDDPGPTRGPRQEMPEQMKGPLMLQGDHGPVAYRNIRIWEHE